MTKVKITIGGINKDAGSSKEYKTGGWRTMKPEVDVEKCIQCLKCFDYCPDGAVKKTEDAIEFDLDYCKGCGICAKECPVKAIVMKVEEK